MVTSPERGKIGTVLLLALLLWTGLDLSSGIRAAHGAVDWLPSEPLHPRSLSDPLEPRWGIAYAPAPEHLDASLGVPVPLVETLAGGIPIQVVLEGAAFLRLGRDGSFFPLRTVDGTFGLGIETRRGNIHGRLRLIHWSAHTADGDSTVTYPGRTFSREFWEVETGILSHRTFLYLRIGSSWHSVPKKKGVDCALGGTWRGRGEDARPVVSVHLSADAERNWRVGQSLFAGVELGWENPLRAGLRAFRGNSFRGQHWKTVERYFGIELQFSP